MSSPSKNPKLNEQELRSLVKLSSTKSVSALVLDWIFIGTTVFICIRFDHFLIYVLCIILMARHQKALLIMVHEAAHGRLYKSKFWNNFVGQVFAAAPFFFSLNAYRKTHLVHHQIPLTPDDPDLTLTGGYPVSGKSFVRKLLRDLFGVSYFKFIKHFLKATKKVGKSTNKKFDFSHLETMSMYQEVFWIVITNFLIFSTFFYFGKPWLYFVLWVLPIWTVLQVILRIRGLIEHAGYKPSADQRRCTRTVVNPIETFFFAPHNVNYHIEHHEYPTVPFYNLPKLHKIFVSQQMLPEDRLFDSYFTALRELVRG